MKKTAVVSGATSGIGRAIALALAAAHYNVVAIGRDTKALEALKTIPNVQPLALDVTDHKAVDDVFRGLDVDVLVNNAGRMPPVRHFCDADESDIDKAIALNISATLHLTRMIAPGMRERSQGHIFFTGSTAGHAAFPNMAVYCATKAAIGGFAAALRLDMAPHGVRVTEIVAGRVETDLYRDVLPAETRAQMYANNAAVQPENVAAMVCAVLDMPQHVDVQRFDILPTYQAPAKG